MVRALAPKWPRGCSRVWLAIGLIVGFPLAVAAQPAGGNAPPGDDAAKGANVKADEPPDADAVVPDAVEARKLAPSQMFKDPIAEKALANTFPQLPEPRPRLSPLEMNAVRGMAQGPAQADRNTIQRYVDTYAASLTNHANIKSMIEPGARVNREIETATGKLREPLEIARKNKNGSFLETYNRALLATLPKLLKNHLLARIEAMLILSQTGSPAALDVFIDQLKDPDQTVWVKLLAAQGLTRAADEGRRDLESRRSVLAARELTELLKQKDGVPWPVQFRALEALGSLRQSSSSLLPNQAAAEMATVALRYLADPEAQPAVRAAAAWALGMMRVSPQVNQYNFALVAHHIGKFAAELGERIATTFTANPIQARFLTGLLLYRVYPAFTGEEESRESGLLHVPVHPNFAPARPAIQAISKQVAAVAAAAVALNNAAGGLVPKARKNLQMQVADLRAILDKTQPANNQLMPGGDAFPVDGPAVAKANGG
jgi:hypothetical protein